MTKVSEIETVGNQLKFLSLVGNLLQKLSKIGNFPKISEIGNQKEKTSEIGIPTHLCSRQSDLHKKDLFQ